MCVQIGDAGRDLIWQQVVIVCAVHGILARGRLECREHVGKGADVEVLAYQAHAPIIVIRQNKTGVVGRVIIRHNNLSVRKVAAQPRECPLQEPKAVMRRDADAKHCLPSRPAQSRARLAARDTWPRCACSGVMHRPQSLPPPIGRGL
jgi:hypothetical protein